ncbi:hypothetical protein T265_00390 [Opisthorchis viverrini]|uniref:Uncharacterized protein n=1 Tax=Opisthorchis viverrini TaxID=6198 RepID=A0A075A2L5_OPIVI|nr:hypothetical protein T265_00390 [Opisthorchis viverrini]KER33958.1 hypothetical protein T265_00390 [Opisthorchis viverrini]
MDDHDAHQTRLVADHRDASFVQIVQLPHANSGANRQLMLQNGVRRRKYFRQHVGLLSDLNAETGAATPIGARRALIAAITEARYSSNVRRFGNL